MDKVLYSRPVDLPDLYLKSSLIHSTKLETLAILEALLKWEDKLLSYKIHVITDHKALEFLKTQ